MKKSTAVAVLVVAVIMSPAHAANPGYHVTGRIALGAPDSWDFVHFEPVQNRIYVAHDTEIAVIDAKTNAVVGKIANIAGAHDVAIVPELDRGFADSGDTGKVTVFALSTLKPEGEIAADADSDAMLYDKQTSKLLVANGDPHSVSIIDVKAEKRIANVALPGSPEMMADDSNGKAYINIASGNEIARLNIASAKIDAVWKTPGCVSPHGLAIDRAARRLFVTCRNAKMIVMDADRGIAIANLRIGGDTDSAAFDPVRKLAFSSNGDGTLSVISEASPDKYAVLATIPTAMGAKTMAEDPNTGRVYTATADIANKPAAAQAAAKPRMAFKPGSLKLLILSP